MRNFYAPDLAHIHHTGFGDFARRSAPGILALLSRAGLDRGLVVDLGCGSGILAQALLAAGYDVLGVDASAAMLELARDVAPGARFAQGSLYAISLPPCIAVTAVGEGLTYWGEDDPREKFGEFFARVFHALAPGGLLLFDVVLRSRKMPMRYHGTQQGEGWRVDVEVEEEPGDFLLTRRITTVRRVDGEERRAHEVHRVRTFERAEVEEALRDRGFSVRVHRRYGDLPLARQRLAFRARKPVRKISA